MGRLLSDYLSVATAAPQSPLPQRGDFCSSGFAIPNQTDLNLQFKPKTLLFFLFLLILNTGFSQKSYVLGRVIDSKTKKGIPDATVVNKKTKQITRSSEKGDFLLWVSWGDSIKVSSVGYKTTGIEWDGRTPDPTIEMKQEAIVLQEVVVKDKRMEQIKQQIDELLASPEADGKLHWKDLANVINTNTSTPGSIGISIDALYDLFSKEGKSKRKLEAMKQEDLRKLLVEYRYNKEYVSYVTKLKGEELLDFMSFCKLPDDFVLTANEYDLTFQVFQCLEEFKR